MYGYLRTRVGLLDASCILRARELRGPPQCMHVARPITFWDAALRLKLNTSARNSDKSIHRIEIRIRIAPRRSPNPNPNGIRLRSARRIRIRIRTNRRASVYYIERHREKIRKYQSQYRISVNVRVAALAAQRPQYFPFPLCNPKADE